MTALAALFLSAFAAATILPMQSEAALAALILAGSHPLPVLIAVAGTGNTLGAVVNWWLGGRIETFRGRPWFPASPQAAGESAGVVSALGQIFAASVMAAVWRRCADGRCRPDARKAAAVPRPCRHWQVRPLHCAGAAGQRRALIQRPAHGGDFRSRSPAGAGGGEAKRHGLCVALRRLGAA